MKMHCGKCHLRAEPEGDFNLRSLGSVPSAESIEHWVASVDYVELGEMPPAEENRMTAAERQRLITFLQKKIRGYDAQTADSKRVPPRRLNNREIANSIRDVLMIEDVGTHQPMANLLGDTLHDGFDTHGDSLGISEFHLDQYIDAFRKVIDTTILTGPRPETQQITVRSDDLRRTSLSQRKRPEGPGRLPNALDFHDMRARMYFENFETVPATGRYRITIRATGIDRGVYDYEKTGIYVDDPIRLSVHLGDRVFTYALPDNEVMQIELDEWLAAGTKIQLSYPTDGLRQANNGNFKFQYRYAHDYLKENDPKQYAKVVASIATKKKRERAKVVSHWSNWTDYWQGPRPRVFGADVEGAINDDWPPKRQIALLGENPKAVDAEAILTPIAARAWRREVQPGELDTIIRLVQSRAKRLGDVEAFKEGIVAILVSPSFLLINPEEGKAAERFATKWSYFLQSTIPNQRLRTATKKGELQTYDAVRDEIARQFKAGEADEFLREFPQAWLQLDRISFMEPDPDRFPLYDRKRLSEDMKDEVLRFFRHAIEHNVPVPELLTADYSFVNADLAKVYDIPGVPQDSELRKHVYSDGKRGGLLGMGAFLTLTADSLGTSPIHRAVYVMENFMGIEPTPPPADVKITEPDVRQAKTIKEILAAHTSDATCASCHKTIDPYGYAFENFGPMGEWRDFYMALTERAVKKKRKSEAKTLEVAVDASATFRSGAKYEDIVEFRDLMKADAARDRFVRCFITKLLTYANGTEPEDYSGVETILAKSAANQYRIIDTIAAVVDSPLFREE
ncbi:DUF1592 domain-containing protein [Novipirellula maiorica]|nr:DUF1592 domain-containing protein [Rhodopirellula maiorica]